MTDLSKELDAEIGEELFRNLLRLTERTAKRHEIPLNRATDFLLAGSLFVAAHVNEISIDEAADLASTIAHSVQHDELPPETRH